MLLEIFIVGFLLIAAGLMVMVPDEEAPIPWLKAKFKASAFRHFFVKAKKERRRRVVNLKVVRDEDSK